MCYSKHRFYPDWFINELVNIEDKESAKNGTLTSTKKVLFQCKKGHTYEQVINCHIKLVTGERKNGCPICRRLCRYAFPDWFINELFYEDDKEKAKNKELNSESLVYFKCKNGCVYLQKISNHIKLSTGEKRQDCPFCKNKNISDKLKKISEMKSRVYPEWFINDIYSKEDKDRAINSTLPVTDKIKFICSKKHIYTQIVSNHITLSSNKEKYGCPICGRLESAKTRKSTYASRRKYPEWFIHELVNELDKERAINGTLTVNDMVCLRCKRGHIYKQRVYNHLDLNTGKKHQGCPICTHHRSKPELEIEDFIISLGYNVEHRRCYIPSENDSKNKRKYLEIDIFIKEKNIGIEFNGSFYHKTFPEDKYSKSATYHYHKFISCKNKGILLITIFDVEWESKREQIKEYIKDTLSGRDNKLSILNNGWINNNYPPLWLISERLIHIESFYKKADMVVYTCGFSILYNGWLKGFNLKGSIQKGDTTISGEINPVENKKEDEEPKSE